MSDILNTFGWKKTAGKCGLRVLFEKTDKHIIPSLERFCFGGRIEVVQGAAEAARAIAYLRQSKLVGIDTETRPVFTKGPMRPVALLQMGDEEICFLFRLNHIGITPEILDFLNDASITKVGLSLKDDLAVLRRRDERVEPNGWVDIQDVVAEMGVQDMSLQKVFANVFHRRISKSAQLSNWEADVLNDSQKVYAATDAYTCILLLKEINRIKEDGNYWILPSEDPLPRPRPKKEGGQGVGIKGVNVRELHAKKRRKYSAKPKDAAKAGDKSHNKPRKYYHSKPRKKKDAVS